MKRIMSGVAYNSSTSTTLGRNAWENGEGKVAETLYQTRAGYYFVHRETDMSEWNPRTEERKGRIVDTIQPCSPDAAREWLMRSGVEVVHNPFGLSLVAATGAEPGATMYIRVPASLKHRVDQAARRDGLSVNFWVTRCIEQRLEA